jgi:hypothetical protein
MSVNIWKTTNTWSSGTTRGFRTPIPFWNAGVPGSTKGFRTPIPFWNAGVPPAAPEGDPRGFRTPIPFWNAGFVATTPATARGFLTPIPFWNAGAGTAIILDEEPHTHVRFRQIMTDDEEIIIMCRTLIEIERCQRS